MSKFKISIISISAIATLIYADMFAFGNTSSKETVTSSKGIITYSDLEKRNNTIIRHSGLRREGVVADVGKLFVDGEFDKLEKVAAKLRKGDRAKNGNWQLYYYYQSLSSRWTLIEPSPEKALYRMFDLWIREKPKSATPRIAKAKAYINFAWQFRGEDYASTVSKERWRLVRQKLAKASKLLTQAEKLNPNDPEIYHLLLKIAKIASGKSIEEMESIFDKGAAIAPTYCPLYYEMGDIYMPRWHGVKGDLEAFMERAVELTKEQEGESFYARIAETEYRYFKFKEFSEKFDIPYERIKRGYIDLLERYPEANYQRNRFCYMACRNDDYETAYRLFEEIGENWNAAGWRSSRKYFDDYKKWLCRKMTQKGKRH